MTRAAPALGRASVHVWQLAPGEPVDAPLLAHRLAELPPEERARYERFRFATKKNEFLFGKLLTRWVLSRYHDRPACDWTFTEAARGKPSACDAGDLRFNMSHTKGLLAVAVTRGHDVGVDVEQVDRRDAGVAERFFAPEEAALVAAAAEGDKDRMFARFWTLKEAYIKAHGDGLSIPLASFRFLLSDPVKIAFRDPRDGDPADWWFAWRDPGPRHALAVAVKSHGPVDVEWLDVGLDEL